MAFKGTQNIHQVLNFQNIVTWKISTWCRRSRLVVAGQPSLLAWFWIGWSLEYSLKMHSCCFRNDLQGTYSSERCRNVYVYVYFRISCPSLQKTCLKFWMSKTPQCPKKSSCQLRLDSKRRPPSGCKSSKFWHTFETCVLSDGDNKDESLFTAVIFFVVLPTWTYPRDLNSLTSTHRNLLKRWKQSLNLQTRSRLGHDSFPWCYLCWADRS